MNKRLFLVHPEISRTKYNFGGVIENEVLELEYIAAIFKPQGYTVEIFDKAIEKRDLKETLAEFQPDVFYVCGRTRQESYMHDYCHLAKSLFPDVITIAGGIHVQHNWERLYADSVDFVLITFDVFKIKDIIDYRAGNRSISDISGVCYKTDGKWTKNEPEPFDIARLPRADREYFYKHRDSYRYLELLPCAHVRTSYSCVYSCTFCYRNTLNCGKYVCRAMEDVVDEIAALDCENIFIIDDDFLVSPARVRQFIALVRQRKIHKKYVAYGRVDFIVNNETLIRKLKDIGFYYLLVGLEANNDDLLKAYDKHINVDENERCIALLNEIGINIMGLLILDLNFTPKDFRHLYRWARKNKLRHVATSIFTPELGLPIFDDNRDRIITDNPEHWDYLHLVAKPEKMGVRGFYFQYYLLLIRFMIRAMWQGVYHFVDYGYFLRSFLKSLFKMSGETSK